MSLRWIGDQKGMEGLPGIPARDLSDEEIKERELDARQLVRSGLYEQVRPAKVEKKEVE